MKRSHAVRDFQASASDSIPTPRQAALSFGSAFSTQRLSSALDGLAVDEAAKRRKCVAGTFGGRHLRKCFPPPRAMLDATSLPLLPPALVHSPVGVRPPRAPPAHQGATPSPKHRQPLGLLRHLSRDGDGSSPTSTIVPFGRLLAFEGLRIGADDRLDELD